MNYTIFLSLLLSSNPSQPEVSKTSDQNKAEATATSPGATLATSNGKPYWIIQNPTDTCSQVLVLYYNDKNELVKKEWRSSNDVNISRPRVVRSLRKSLNEALKLNEEVYLD